MNMPFRLSGEPAHPPAKEEDGHLRGLFVLAKWVEREIEALLLAHLDATLTVSEIARRVFAVKTVTATQPRSTRPAPRHVPRRNPAWSRNGVETRRNHPVGPATVGI
jgi:hypothetical protein